MRIPSIKELMREQARFVKYQDGKLWYQILYTEGGAYTGGSPHLFDFPVPIDDSGGGEFGKSEKAVYLMRWIRKHIEYLTEAQNEDTNY